MPASASGFSGMAPLVQHCLLAAFASPSAQRVPSVYPAALLWCSPAVISTGSFVIVLQVSHTLLHVMLGCTLHVLSASQVQCAHGFPNVEDAS